MSDDEDIAALVVDNGSGMCKGEQIHSQTKTRGHCSTFDRLIRDTMDAPQANNNVGVH